MTVCRCNGTGGGPRASKAEVGGVRDLLEWWEFSPMLSGGESKTSLKPGHLLAGARSPDVSTPDMPHSVLQYCMLAHGVGRGTLGAPQELLLWLRKFQTPRRKQH